MFSSYVQFHWQFFITYSSCFWLGNILLQKFNISSKKRFKKKKKCQESKWKYKVAFCTVTGLKLSHHKSRIAESFQEFVAKIVTSLRVICGKYFSFHLSITLNNLINNIQSSSKPVLINSIAITIKNMTRRHRLRNILFFVGGFAFFKNKLYLATYYKKKITT